MPVWPKSWPPSEPPLMAALAGAVHPGGVERFKMEQSLGESKNGRRSSGGAACCGEYRCASQGLGQGNRAGAVKPDADQPQQKHIMHKCNPVHSSRKQQEVQPRQCAMPCQSSSLSFTPPRAPRPTGGQAENLQHHILRQLRQPPAGCARAQAACRLLACGAPRPPASCLHGPDVRAMEPRTNMHQSAPKPAHATVALRSGAAGAPITHQPT